MHNQYSRDSMLDMYIFETAQNIEELESVILFSEKDSCYTRDAINEIFRIMHTIKGSSAMMLYNEISNCAHNIEDLFFYIREKKPQKIDCTTLSDIVLEGIDFIKTELKKIEVSGKADGECSVLICKIKEFLELLIEQNPSGEIIETQHIRKKQQYYIVPDSNADEANKRSFKATIFFDDGCEMENIRAYTIIHNLKQITSQIYFFPEDIIEEDSSANVIKEEGFKIFMKTDKTYDEVNEFFMKTIFLRELQLVELENDDELKVFIKPNPIVNEENLVNIPALRKEDKDKVEKEIVSTTVQSIVSVNVSKLDKLMDLVGEMVIAEAMVVQNSDLEGLELENFRKAARQLHKITGEIQDVVMSVRMVPLSTTFQKMHRIVRDMCKKLNKDVKLELKGEETEVDKNIIEHISDPLMHLIRNSIDHGIEIAEDREAKGKLKAGKITLEAKNSGSDVLVVVKDDGRGLSKEKILKKAKENGLLDKSENEMTDKEIYNLILMPGFSTKDSVSEFSGRGVGMDVVVNNLNTVGGSVTIDSLENAGTTITLKIPLTLAIIDGMNVKVGISRYTIPTITIKESFRPKESDVIKDPDGNEMIMVRGQCYPILRLHEHFGVKTKVTSFTEGILIMVEQDAKTLCIFADELLGQQQVVVKTLPKYIKNTKNIKGLAGCTLLGDGRISLIIDVGGLIKIM